MVSVAAAIVAVLAALGVGVWNFILAPAPDTRMAAPAESPTAEAPAAQASAAATTASSSPSPSATPTPTPSPEPAAFPAGAQPCAASHPASGGISASAAGNNVTSCPFAEEVRRAYADQPQRNTAVTVNAFSPVTGRNYAMACSGDRVVTCTGGNNAVVYLR